LANRAEIVVCRGVGDDSHFGQATEHDQGIMRPATETLGTSEQVHQRGIAQRTRLHGAPRKIVKLLVLAACIRVGCQLLALVPFPTCR
jgi:hypothetical protein